MSTSPLTVLNTGHRHAYGLSPLSPIAPNTLVLSGHNDAASEISTCSTIPEPVTAIVPVLPASRKSKKQEIT